MTDKPKNDHGWQQIGALTDIRSEASDGIAVLVLGDSRPVVQWAPVRDRHACDCTRQQCHRAATQEDLLCDECRETCR